MRFRKNFKIWWKTPFKIWWKKSGLKTKIIGLVSTWFLLWITVLLSIFGFWISLALYTSLAIVYLLLNAYVYWKDLKYGKDKW